MKLILMLAAIYSMIYHQSRKEEKIADSLPERIKDARQDLKPSEEAGYGDGLMFSGFHPQVKELQPKSKRVYQQKNTTDYRYPFYPALMTK